jgi:hypothetical protein
MFIHTYSIQKDVLHDDNSLWYVAAFETLPQDKIIDMTVWCVDSFGNPGFNHLTYQTRWNNGIRYGEIHFDRKSDLEWFMLRWS